MAFPTSLTYNISTNSLVKSATQPGAVGAISWFSADTKNLVIQFVQDAEPGKVTVVPATGIGLQVAIGTPGGTVISSATAPPAVSDFYTVPLPLNTSAMVAALVASPGGFPTTFEFRTSDGSIPQRYEFPLTIKPALISDTLTATAPPDTAIGVNAANSTFVRKLGVQGDFQIWTSPDGLKTSKVYLGNDGQLKADAIT